MRVSNSCERNRKLKRCYLLPKQSLEYFLISWGPWVSGISPFCKLSFLCLLWFQVGVCCSNLVWFPLIFILNLTAELEYGWLKLEILLLCYACEWAVKWLISKAAPFLAYELVRLWVTAAMNVMCWKWIKVWEEISHEFCMMQINYACLVGFIVK